MKTLYTQAAARRVAERAAKHGLQKVPKSGVGLGQVTFWTYIRDNPDLWKPRCQVDLATSILADYVHRLGESTGVGAYNGGEKKPNKTYAKQVLAKAEKWRPLLAKD